MLAILKKLKELDLDMYFSEAELQNITSHLTVVYNRIRLDDNKRIKALLSDLKAIETNHEKAGLKYLIENFTEVTNWQDYQDKTKELQARYCNYL